jgi:hypothetical protein
MHAESHRQMHKYLATHNGGLVSHITMARGWVCRLHQEQTSQIKSTVRQTSLAAHTPGGARGWSKGLQRPDSYHKVRSVWHWFGCQKPFDHVHKHTHTNTCHHPLHACLGHQSAISRQTRDVGASRRRACSNAYVIVVRALLAAAKQPVQRHTVSAGVAVQRCKHRHSVWKG